MTTSDNRRELADWEHAFLQQEQLPDSYGVSARKWFAPLVSHLILRQNGADAPLVVGLNGCQGSGKTTLSKYLVAALAMHGVPAVCLSLDDVYLSKSERERLAEAVHPLLITRGVPGTHEVPLLIDTINALCDRELAETVVLPRFDKASDDRAPEGEWEAAGLVPRIIFIEGWCMGVRPQTQDALIDPVNSLEREEDPTGVWRRFVNRRLAQDFPPLYAQVDEWLMLRAPSFDCALRWRQEQEEKLALARGGMSEQMLSGAALERFVAHFERLTRHGLKTLPTAVDHLFTLGSDRCLASYRGIVSSEP